MRLSTRIFGKSKSDIDFDRVIALIDKALDEHKKASAKHEANLENLKKELGRIESKGEVRGPGTPSTTPDANK